jgi:hypothetical protein
MLTWNQYKKLNENRNLNEDVVQRKYQVYLSEIQLNEFLSQNEINQPTTPSVSGAGNFRTECDPSNGIGVYIDAIDEETGEPTALKYLGRLDYIGDINFRPAYRIILILPNIFPVTIHWDSTIDKWRETQVIEEDTYYWLSDSLISSNWVAQQEAAGEEGSGNAVDFTTCGYPELDRWCVEVDNVGGTVYNTNAVPGWNGIETTETPNFWSFAFGFYMWDSDNSEWMITSGLGGDPTTAGDDINVLPEVTIGGVTITPSLGAC